MNGGVLTPTTESVTLVFSDIEGSTTLLIRLGDRYAEALAVQRELMREAIREGGGRELGTEGDSFYIAFTSAIDAVSSCVAAQRALHAYRWPEGARVNVRMGLHTGRPSPFEDVYVGIDVHRAARIAAAAHGAQVVLSDATRAIIAPDLPDGIALRDLGWHRLKDIEEPEHIFQLIISGLEDQFPPLKTLGAPTSLPHSTTRLVGRERIFKEIQALTLEPTVRLVSLTGAGGIGKTRLALAAAEELGRDFRHGVFFVSLATASDTEMMWRSIADAIGTGDEGLPASAVVEFLTGRHALLILDNLEQISGAGEVASTLLQATSELVILTTSRRPLRVSGEHEFPVPPLDIPESDDPRMAESAGAVQLFAQHAGMVKPGFAITNDNIADVATICRRLDGLPLAIELVAARCKLLSPKALLARLDHSLDLATGGDDRPSRQRTLRNAIAWSYDLLSPTLQLTFRCMGVFVGGCDLDALANVVGAIDSSGTTPDVLTLVELLLDANLINVLEGGEGEPRASMLEMIREFAVERVEVSHERDLLGRRHAEHYASLAEEMSIQLRGSERLLALDRLEIEHDNARAALGWSLGSESHDSSLDPGRTEIGLRLVLALAPFWYQHGYAGEGRSWLEQALALATDESGALLAQVAHWFGVLLQQQGENGAALKLFDRSLAIWRELDDPDQIMRELNSLAITHRGLGDLDTARTLINEAVHIARSTGNHFRLSAALTTTGHVETSAGNILTSMAALQEALRLDLANGDMQGAAINRQSLALTKLHAGDADEAARLMAETVDYVVASGEVEFLACTFEMFANVAACRADPLQAALFCGVAERIRGDAGMPISQFDRETMEKFVGPARATVDPGSWEAQVAKGHAHTRQDIAALLSASDPTVEAGGPEHP